MGGIDQGLHALAMRDGFLAPSLGVTLGYKPRFTASRHFAAAPFGAH
jgi:stage V sporulation protein SpoVS